ncbi:MAG TPA: adenylosuccinate synthase [Oligoflexia bacterium]|nr:adenylosuccinate synthase [Oligoflexia bacterium]HMP49326.1 adenylosuccinate synthase [Oligoflexia bacterium]
MPVSVIVGAQWGDEGKGKIVDYLCERSDIVVRFQGGNNAGHTIIIDGKKTALHIIPSGILRESNRCLLASGVVLDPEVFIKELEGLEVSGIVVTPERLGISGEVALIMPYHRAIDVEREKGREQDGSKIGTTGKGIGPCYEDAVSRNGIRVSDLANPSRLRYLVERNVKEKNKYLAGVLNSTVQFSADEVFQTLMSQADNIVPFISNISAELARAHIEGKYVMFEGAQGTLLDIYHGTYPYVTSSSTVAGFACASAGFSPKHIDHILGVCKAYTTRVGEGPFPTEDTGPDGSRMRELGHEFGTTTGRPRRCGWLDIVALKKAIRINGITSLIITKMDILTGFKTIRLGTHYLFDGQPVEDLPHASENVSALEVFYEEMSGWDEDITGVKSLDDLPQAASRFLKRIEELVGVEIGAFSVGPDRSQAVITSDSVRSLF